MKQTEKKLRKGLEVNLFPSKKEGFEKYGCLQLLTKLNVSILYLKGWTYFNQTVQICK